MAAALYRNIPQLTRLVGRASNIRAEKVLISHQVQPAFMKNKIADFSAWSQRNINFIAVGGQNNQTFLDRNGGTHRDVIGNLHQVRYMSDAAKRKAQNVMDDVKEKTSEMLADLKHLKSAPTPALTLGISGLLPFVAAPTYMFFTGAYVTSVAFSQLAYGACILSFLGGVRWGFTVPEESSVKLNWENLGYSVAPPLIAWVGLLVSPGFGSLTMITGLLGAAYVDTISSYPPWFKALRVLLTGVAVFCICETLLFRMIFNERKSSSVPPVEAETKNDEASS